MFFLAALLLQTLTPAPPPPPIHGDMHGGPEPMTCPIGGEKFSAWQPRTYSTYGSRPDGRPYSYLPFPFPIPECPSNHMIVFDQSFSEAEKGKLAELIASPEYRRQVDSETPYYRGAWLAARLGRSDDLVLGLLLRAIWEVTPASLAPKPNAGSLDRMRRYQEEFAERADRSALPAKEIVWIQARAANALRQIGRFDAAEAMRVRAASSVAQLGDAEGWDKFLERLKVPIARRDAAPEPLDMIPPQQVPFACLDRARPLDPFDQQACSTPEVKLRIAGIEAQRAKAAN